MRKQQKNKEHCLMIPSDQSKRKFLFSLFASEPSSRGSQLLHFISFPEESILLFKARFASYNSQTFTFG
jgi:hypothetical protein